MSESIEPRDREERRTAAIIDGLGTVVPIALAFEWHNDDARAVFDIAPESDEGEVARHLLVIAESDIRMMTAEQRKWFGMGAVSAAIAIQKFRETTIQSE